MQSDIMIVRMTDDDFFVSEKIHGRDPYYKLIIERSKTSAHFKTMDEAHCAAKEMRNNIIATSPDCSIVEIDIRLFPKHAKQKDTPISYEYDNNHQKVFGITSKGKRVFDFPEDAPYIFIDKVEYRNKLSYFISAIESEPFEYKNLGILQAYNLALECSLPYIRYEIYKAEKLLKTFECDQELYKCDIEFYLGYIDGLNNSIIMQKECALQLRQDWKIHIFDLTKSYHFNVLLQSYNYNFGQYSLEIHNSPDEFIYNGKSNELLIFFSDKKSDLSPIYEKYNIQNYHYIEFDNQKRNNPITNNSIETIIENMFKLGHGDPDLKINENWVSIKE